MVCKDKKVEFIKVGENANRVKLLSLYDNNCSSQEYVVVDDEMLEYLIAATRKANANERRYRRHFICLPEEDTVAAKIGVVTASAEEKYLTEAGTVELSKILTILSTLTNAQRRRIYKRFNENLSFEEIGRSEGVSASVIKRSCEITFQKLKPYVDFLQHTMIIRWMDLL